MSEMVERAVGAYRLAKYRLKKSDTLSSPQDDVVLVRAALEALREPTNEMVAAGYNAVPYGSLQCWRAMIDEALK